MARFVAEVDINLEAEDLQAAGGVLRRVQEVASTMTSDGIVLRRVHVKPVDDGDEKRDGWTSYGGLRHG